MTPSQIPVAAAAFGHRHGREAITPGDGLSSAHRTGPAMHPDVAHGSRDLRPTSRWHTTPGICGRNIIIGIGIDCYQHYPVLANAVRDAMTASRLFQRMGFEQATAPLLDDRATAQAIQELVTDDLTTLTGPDDSLVLFYAGHGTTRRHRLGDRVITTGYLVPVDAQDKVATWIELEGWLRAISRLPPRHILVILDACHSGIALDPVIQWRDRGSSQDRTLATLAARRSRRVITSALADEVACDSGPAPGHSLFTGCLIEALTHGVRAGGGGLVSGSELALYVQRRVASYPDARQTPDFGAFAFDDRGEMAIPIRAASLPHRTALGWRAPSARRATPAP